MLMLSVALVLQSAAVPADAGMSGAWLASFFNEVCFGPFGQSEAVQKAVETSQSMTFTPIDARPGAPQMGRAWEAPKASVSYTDAEWLPRDLPSPQCTLSLSAEQSFDHLQSVNSIQEVMPIGMGRTKGKANAFQTEWNFVGPRGEKRRMFMKSSPAGNGISVSVSLLGLRK
jgi:hypothetical protein